MTTTYVVRKLWVVDEAMSQNFRQQPLGHRFIDDPELFSRVFLARTGQRMRSGIFLRGTSVLKSAKYKPIFG